MADQIGNPVAPMTSRERVLAACRHQTPDRTPMDFGGTAMSGCTIDFLRRLRETLGFPTPPDRDPDWVWVDEAIQRHLGVDLRLVPGGPPLPVLRDLDPAAYEREVTTRWQRTHQGSDTTQAHCPLTSATYQEIRALKPQRAEPPPHLAWQIEVAKAYQAAGYATTYWVASGFFEQGCWSRGYEQFAMDLAGDPDIVRALFDLWLEEKLSVVETMVKPLAPHIDIFCFGDDLGMQTGLFMSPRSFRASIMPYMKRVYDRVHAVAPASLLFHHSCGSVYRLLDDLREAGADLINPIQPSAFEMEAERLKAKGRGRLCFHGGMDLQRLLPFGTPAEVRAEAERRMRILGDGGGYICAPAHSLPTDVPVENLLAIFGRFPSSGKRPA
jgi:uroporphyrinogen decarboxylase